MTDVEIGDMNNDGALDIIFLFESAEGHVFLNDSSNSFATSIAFASNGENLTKALAIADMNGDGSLDIVVCSYFGSRVYLNDGEGIVFSTLPFATDDYSIEYVPLGDMDNDGDLDIVVGGIHSKILLNNGAGQLNQTISFTTRADESYHVLGDMNNDGFLDIVVPGTIYLNDSGNGVFLPTTISEMIGRAQLYDVNQDGLLDIISEKSIFVNSGNGILYTKLLLDLPSEVTRMQVADINDDGYFDIIANKSVWQNNGRNEFLTKISYETTDYLLDIRTFGDINSDGLLDIVTTGANSQIYIYTNEGNKGYRKSRLNNPEPGHVQDIAIGDITGDGALDFVTVNTSGLYTLFINDKHGEFSTSVRFGPQIQGFTHVALGDMNRDGTLDIVIAHGYATEPSHAIYLSNYRRSSHKVNNEATIFVHPPRPTVDTVSSFPNIFESRVIPISYTLSDAEQEGIGHIRAYFSLNGGGLWQPAIAASGTVTTHLSSNQTHIFYWDTFASGLFGLYDNVVFRIEAYPQADVSGPTQTFKYIHSSSGSYFWPYVASTTPPFQVRGTQIRVVDVGRQPVVDGIVYQQPYGATVGGLMLGTSSQPFQTNRQGYLSGRGAIQLGDTLLALGLAHETPHYRLYHTSAIPTDRGVDAYLVRSSGVQTLTISHEHPLVLFDLTISLEWDASNDPAYLNKLHYDLIESSTALYDWTNGQVALGKVTIYQGREHWDDAHIQILASNQVRPSANRGGIATDTTILTHTIFTEPITATRGIVRIGPNWTRYGDSDPNYVYDWQRVLAHELGHYLLFLEDTYLGLDEASGLLVPVDTCGNSAMSDPYEEAGTEFRYNDERWQAECGHTLAELPDWDLIRLAYPALHAPPPVNPGPGTMPFLFTAVEIKPPPAGASPLANPLISLGNASSTLLSGRVYLRRPNQQLLDLGKYLGNELLVRGGQEGDELCIFAATAYACSYLSNNQPVNFIPKPLWTSMIAVTPNSTTTLTIFVEQSAASQLTATIYPDGAAPQTVLLTPGNPQSITLTQPAVEALVEIIGAADGERFITGYAIGSGPGRLRSFDGPGRLRSFDGPVSSGDGGVVLYPPLATAKDTFISLQLAATLSDLPLGLVPVGRAYYVHPSAEIPDYAGGSIAFQYLGRDVDQFHLPEENLAVYHWDGAQWTCFKCAEQVRNPDQNVLSAPLAGPGLYMLTGFQLALNGPGMNMIGYPLPYSLPVTKALTSLAGAYNVIYHYDVTNPTKPWSAFGADAPPWANTLSELKPNRGYWLYVTNNLLWSITGQGTTAAATSQQPPAVFYGIVSPTDAFTPTVDMVVTANINGTPCGQARTRLVDGQIGYVIDVLADDPLNPSGCVRPGQTVSFLVDGRTVTTTGTWDNTRMQRIDLSFTTLLGGVGDTNLQNRLYLPFVAN